MRTSVLKLATPFLLVASLAVMASGQALAQSSGNAYRAEIVVLERIVAPENVEEQMTNRHPEPMPDVPGQMMVVDADGNAHSTLRLVPKREMTLSRAADRLVNSGRYRVLMTAGWYQSFPPNYQGQPLQVAVGDWLAAAGVREVEGTITIDRQRYLHVQVALNHWQAAANPTTEQVPEPAVSQAAVEAGLVQDSPLPVDTVTEPQQNAELLTWIRETRRMRSEEIHFLDSPTIGVLVFFRKIGG